MAQYKYPVIPETIRVHLGSPSAWAENIEVPFVDYIKAVASSEIYPTWPENAIRANVYAQISYALNRIYTEWYPAQGYAFDITNTTQFDQAYQPGISITENINRIVDEIFNSYVRRDENVEPFFTQYCNGTTSTCPGLSQWGTVSLAEQGLSPLEILQYYYGDKISIVENVPVQDVLESYPGVPLEFGVRGNDVKLLQNQLNRIRQNYPGIPPIRYVDGVYGVDTQNAVRTFQTVFGLNPTGAIDKSTWYQIKRIYNAVKKLSELASEGISATEVAPVVATELKFGSKGNEVQTLQYYLSAVGYFVPTVPTIAIDGIYGAATDDAVRQFQATYGIPVTGVVDDLTWNTLQDTYDQIIGTLPPEYFDDKAQAYPGYVLKIGMENSDVSELQKYLLAISKKYSKVPPVEVTGYFDEITKLSVQAFQELYGIPAEGLVGATTWNALSDEYNLIIEDMSRKLIGGYEKILYKKDEVGYSDNRDNN